MSAAFGHSRTTMEVLEDRTLLAAAIGGDGAPLEIDLDQANESLTIEMTDATTYVLTTDDAGGWDVSGLTGPGITVSGGNDEILTIDLTAATLTEIQIGDSAAGTLVDFVGTNAFAFEHDFDVLLDAGSDGLDVTGATTFGGTTSLTVDVDSNIVVAAALTAVDGNISLTADAATGVAINVTFDVQTNTGNIDLTGTSGDSTGITLNADLISGTGDITIDGTSTGGDGDGVGIWEAVTTGGDIEVTGEGDGVGVDLLLNAGSSIDGAEVTLNIDSVIAFGGAEISADDLIVLQRTPGTSIRIGDGTGDLELDTFFLDALQAGFDSITIGDAATGAVDIDNVTLAAGFTGSLSITGTGITVTELDAGDADVELTATTGAIVTSDETTVDVTTTGDLALSATANIGDADPLRTDVGGLLTATSGAAVTISEEDDLDVGDIFAAGDVSLTAVGDVTVGTGVMIVSTGGAISIDADDITITEATLDADTTITLDADGAVTLTDADIDFGTTASISAVTALTITETGDFEWLHPDVTISVAANGDITLHSDGTLTIGTDLAVTGNGMITLTAGEDIVVESNVAITAVDGDISLDADADVSVAAGAEIVSTGGDVSIEGVDITVTEATIGADTTVTIDGTGVIVLDDVTIDADNLVVTGRIVATDLTESVDLTVTAAGAITFATAGDLTVTDITVGAGESVDLSADGTLTIDTDVSVTGTGTIDLTAGEHIVISMGETVSSENGNITLNADGGILVDMGSTISTVEGTISLTAEGTVTGAYHGIVVDDATITATGDGSIDLDGTGSDGGDGVLLLDADITTGGAGSISITGEGDGAGVDLSTTGVTTIGGTDATGDITLSVDSLDVDANLSIESDGSFSLTSRTGVSIGLGTGASGVLQLTQAELDAILEDGFASINISTSDAVTITDISFTDPVSLVGATIVGGEITAPEVTLTGQIIPGGGAGTGILDVAGDLTLGAGSTLVIGLDGTGPNEFGQVVVDGDLTIGANVQLDVTALGGLTLQTGQQFTIITADSITGEFVGLAEGDLVEIDPDFFAEISYQGDMVVLTVVPVPRDNVVVFDESTGRWWASSPDELGEFQQNVVSRWSTAVTWDFHEGDFTGNGLMDIAGRQRETGQWWVLEAVGDGTFTQSHWATWAPDVQGAVTHWNDVFVGDFTGDGTDDIVGRDGAGQFWLAESTGSNFATVYAGRWINDANWHTMVAGDFNGDGKVGIAGLRSDTGHWFISHRHGDGFAGRFFQEFAGTWQAPDTADFDWHNILAGDVTGDGMDDIIAQVGEGPGIGQWWIGESTDIGGNDIRFAPFFGGTFWGTGFDYPATGDFDGNGQVDLVARNQATGQWGVALSQGAGMQFQRHTLGALPATATSTFLLGDFNGSGRTDVAAFDVSTGQWWVGLTDPSGASFNVQFYGVWSNIGEVGFAAAGDIGTV